MSDLILKAHGAHAVGTISHTTDGKFSATLVVKDLDKGFQQDRGPEIFPTEARARDWILLQAGHHGFQDDDFDIHIETR